VGRDAFNSCALASGCKALLYVADTLTMIVNDMAEIATTAASSSQVRQ
jgi:hypothetical protein